MEWSYIAGYFDGEGHVGLHPSRGRQGKNTKSKITTLCWYNSHRESLEAMREFMGVGFIGLGNGEGKGQFPGSRKFVYVLRISRKLALIRVIDAMLPHLLIKRDACLALRQHLIDHVNEKRAENFGKLLTIPREDLRRLYEDEGLTLAAIAERYQATGSGIARVFHLHGLVARGHADHFKGVPKSEATRARMKASRAKMWEDPVFRAAQVANMQEGRRAAGYKMHGYHPKPGMQGEKHHMSKLTDAQRDEMRQKYATGETSLLRLAAEYGVSKKTVLNTVHGKIRVGSIVEVPEGQVVEAEQLTFNTFSVTQEAV